MKYQLKFRKIKLESGEINYDVWIESKSCNDEYLGQFKSLKLVHKEIKRMVEKRILS